MGLAELIGPAPRRFGITPRFAEEQVQADPQALPTQVFQPLPPPTGAAPYRLKLADVLPANTMNEIATSGELTFHCVGDTGGIRDPQPQVSVVQQMAADLSGANPVRFLYHLGDVVYFNGQKVEYYPQFYEPYMHYTVPVMAIPGNHDGDAMDAATEPSLAGFVENFCAPTPKLTSEAQDTQRDAMTQPHVFWTLETPLITIIGLYSNCPDGGVIKDDQAKWLEGELGAADKSLPVIVAVHHPIFSADQVHGGNVNLTTLLDSAIAQAGRTPDAVFNGHVHNYQRFIRSQQGRQVPYIVAGAGGYHNLHKVAPTQAGAEPVLPWQLPAPSNDTTLFNYCDDRFGFLRVSVTKSQIAIQYVAVSPAAVAGQPSSSKVFDSFTIDLASHTVK